MDGTEIDDAALDRLLAQAPVPAASPALERRILADFDRARTRWSFAKALRAAADAVWPGGPVWQPAGAFALALLIGVGVAVLAPFDIAQQDDASANVFALDGAPDVDAGQGI
jgi:hypothetical protein